MTGALRIATWRWLRDRLGELTMMVAHRVQRLKRSARDRERAAERDQRSAP